MDSQFWLGVIVTIVVGLPGAYGIGILANMHTPRLVHFLESRKLLKKHKTRQQALRVFNRIKAFRDGTRDTPCERRSSLRHHRIHAYSYHRPSQ